MGDLLLRPLSQRVLPGLYVLIPKSERALQPEINGTTRGRIQQRPRVSVIPLLIPTAVALHPLSRWDITIPGVMSLKKLMDKYTCPEYQCQGLLRTLTRYPISLINAKPQGHFLGVSQCHAYQRAKTLVLRSEAQGLFPKTLGI